MNHVNGPQKVNPEEFDRLVEAFKMLSQWKRDRASSATKMELSNPKPVVKLAAAN